jgi:hypothetical protein
MNLITLYLAGAKNTNNWRTKKGDLQHAFPLDVLMVPSSAITVVANDERLTCGGFSHGEAVHLRNFEFIAVYFSGLSLSPRRGDTGTAFMGLTHSGASTLWWAMIEYSAKEFLMASSGEGSFGLPSPRRRGLGASSASVTTTPKIENALVTQAMTMVPLRMVAPQLETCLPFERHHTHHEGQRHGEASSPVGKPLPWFNRKRRCDMSSHTRHRGS